MRNYTRKIVLFMVLFAGITAYSFAETIFTSTLNFTRLYEQYTDENIGRDLEGVSFDISINYYPGRSPLGWYVKTSLGSSIAGTEWKSDAVAAADIYSSTDIRFSLGPSLVLRAGSKLLIPISIGPIVSNYREEINEYYYDYYGSTNNTGFFEALNVGALADIGIVLNPFRRFAIKTGVSVSWDILRWEKGLNATTAFRTINSGEFTQVNYSAYKISLYFGLGLCFENTRVRD